MKFTFAGSGSSTGHSPAFIENNIGYDRALLHYEKICEGKIKEPDEFETTTKNKFELRWYYTLFYNGTGFYNYEAWERFYIEEEEIKPTDEQLIYLITRSHIYLTESFEIKTKPYSILLAVPSLTDEEIQKTLPDLHKNFPSTQE